MTASRRKNIQTQSSTDFTGIDLKKPALYAAGLTGVKVALQHTFKEMGVIKSFQTLAHMNQKDGFDCPGCAWPDPENRSKLGEYCENGAKALAEEATSITRNAPGKRLLESFQIIFMRSPVLTKPYSTHLADRVTKLPFYMDYSSEPLARTICPTAPICVMNPAELDFLKR